jgi:undecaprenyl-diphosphatase
MPLWMALVLGIVEGLTEYLPVSSTGHLILVSHALGLHDEATKTFEVVIQSGAVLAVLVHYRTLLGLRVKGLFRQDPDALRLLGALLSAFVPTAIAGLLLRKAIKARLFGPLPVAGALIVGGVLMVVLERLLSKRSLAPIDRLEQVDAKRGFLIGVAQCLALWPGASRAMCTIVGGQLCGLTTAVAAEFSFLLALPVLGAATVLDLYKGGRALFATGEARAAVLTGFVVSFLVAWLVIGLFLRFLRSRGLALFGWYRILLGGVVLAVLVRP